MASIEKRGDSYRITVSCGRDIYGKKKFEKTTFTPDPGLTPKQKEKAVQNFARDFENQVINGLVLDGRKTSLKFFCDRWLSEVAPQRLEPGTIERYTAELGKILPKLGHYMLSDLKPHTLNSFFAAMTKDGARKDGKKGGYSKNSIAKTKAVLSSILSTAAEWELIDRNPLEKVHFNAEATADKLKFFTPEQASAFLQFIEHPYTINVKGHKRIDDTGKPYTVGDYQKTIELRVQVFAFFIVFPRCVSFRVPSAFLYRSFCIVLGTGDLFLCRGYPSGTQKSPLVFEW